MSSIGQKRQRYDSDSDIEEEQTTTVAVVQDDDDDAMPSSTKLSTQTQPTQTAPSTPGTVTNVPSAAPSAPSPPAPAPKGKRRAAPSAPVFASGRSKVVVMDQQQSTSILVSPAPTAMSLIERMKVQLGGGGGVLSSSSSTKVASSSLAAEDEGTLFSNGKRTQSLEDAIMPNAIPKTKKKKKENGEEVSNDDDSDEDEEGGDREDSHQTANNSNSSNNNNRTDAKPSPSKDGLIGSSPHRHPASTNSPKQSSKTAPVQAEDPSARDVIRKVRSDDRAWARGLQVGGMTISTTSGQKRGTMLPSVVEYAGDAGFVEEDLGSGGGGRDDAPEGDEGRNSDRLAIVSRTIHLDRLKTAHDRMGYRMLRTAEKVESTPPPPPPLGNGALIGFDNKGSSTVPLFAEDTTTTTLTHLHPTPSSSSSPVTISSNDNINQRLATALRGDPLLVDYAMLIENGSLNCSFASPPPSSSSTPLTDLNFIVNARGVVPSPKIGEHHQSSGLTTSDLRSIYSTSVDDTYYTMGPHHTGTSSGSASKLISPVSPTAPGDLPMVAVPPLAITKDRFGVPIQQVSQEYEIAASRMGMERVSSGWRWDGIVRGNTRILDHYRPHHSHHHHEAM